MKVAVIGRGRVGLALAPCLARAGHEVRFGVRDPADPKHVGGPIPVASTREAAGWADIVIAAIMWEAVDGFLADVGDLDGKILVDCINPYDFAGGLRRLISGDTSTATLLQARTAAKVVKTLNQVGSPVMASPSAYAVKPLQFVAADDASAKSTVIMLLQSMDYDARDAGGLEHAADLEAMARVWIAQAFVHRMQPDTSWALVRPS